MKLNLYLAALNHHRSKAQEALAALELFFNNPSAVSGHTDYVDEVNRWTKVLADSERALETLNKYFGAQVNALQAPPKDEQ
mgnify:CR=1 FL=1|tara:strand:+ start:22 stop:264 length:243 start_codon:yes stop_codon:yes gene_type:complete